MKLLDKAFDRAVEMAKPVQGLITGLKGCADTLSELAQTTAAIAYNLKAHHNVLLRLWDVQQYILNRLGDQSMDMSMPDLETKVPPVDSDEAQVARTKATHKPN